MNHGGPVNWENVIARWWMEDANRGVVVTDTDLRVVRWNRWMTEHSGVAAEEAVGRSILEWVDPGRKHAFEATYHDVLEGKAKVLSERFHRFVFPMDDHSSRSRTRMHQTVSIAPLMEENRVVGTLTLVENVTDRVYREEEIRRQLGFRDLMFRVDQAILSHELPRACGIVAEELRNFLACRQVWIFWIKVKECGLWHAHQRNLHPEKRTETAVPIRN